MKGVTDRKMVDFSKLIIIKVRNYAYCELQQGMHTCTYTLLHDYFLVD